MPKKRANGEGSLRKRKDGRWEGRYTAGRDPTTGKPIHKSVLTKTQAEAKEKLKQAIAEAEKLDMSRAKSYTLGAWIKLWYEVYAEPRLREKTKHYYLNYIDNHIIPELGNTPLEKLTTIQIQKFYNDLQKSGRIQRYTHIKLKDKGLSTRVVRGIHTLLNNCLEQAVGQIRADLVLRQYLHLALFQLWQAAALGGVGEDQPLRYRLLQAVVQQRVDTPHHACAEALVLQFDVGIPLDTSGLLQVVVELLNLDGGQLFQRRTAQFRDNVVVDVVEVVVLGFLSQARLGVDLIPQLDPRAQRVGLGAAHVQLFSLRNGLLEREQAVAERLLLTNPAKGCRLPKLEKREMKILPEDKIGPYLAEAERRGLLAAFYLELTTGLRRGELLALLWTDLDVENMTISVSKQVNRINGELVVSQPKTPNSIRKLAIPQRAVELLVEEHAKHPHSPYLFVSSKTGTMFDPDSFRHTHEKILKAIGAEHIRFHDLRHPYVKPTTKKFITFFEAFRAAI